MIELERTYFAKYLPEGLKNCKKKEILDIYIPISSKHPILRIRKSGDKYEITKKQPVDGVDSTKQIEETISLTQEEYNDFAQLEGKRSHRFRYLYPYKNQIAEIDIFLDELKGLVWIDFEFETEEDMASFEMPDFCLVEVSQEVFIAGGMICGKKYEQLEPDLKRFNYKKLSLDD